MLESSSLWPEVLEILKLQLTRASFTLFDGSSAGRQNGTLTIHIPNPLALESIEARYRKHIEKAVANVAGEPLEVKFTALAGPEEAVQPELFFTGTYRDAYNEIVQPNLQFYTSQYFYKKWLPILGPELWLLIWEMRTKCYWNKETGVKRDTFEVTYKQLGKDIGMSELKVWRLLHPSDLKMRSMIDKFILRSETKRRYSSAKGGTVNDKTIWRIRLDDPLAPDDEEKLKVSNFTGETREVSNFTGETHV